MYFLGKVIHGLRKYRLFVTDDYISQLLPLALLTVTCDIAFSCVFVSQARHFVLPACEGFFNDFGSRPKRFKSYLQQRWAK